MTTLFYQLEIQSLAHHLFRVRLRVPANGQQTTNLWLPNWLPGSYKIRDFARHIIEFSARNGDGQLPWHKLDKHRWQVANARRDFELDYLVYAFERSVRACHLDEGHAYCNGSSLFLCPEGIEEAGFELEIRAPALDTTANWRLYTGLPALAVDERGFGRYGAQSYSQLIDCPIEMGEAEVVMFGLGDIPHRLVVSGQHFGNLQTIAQSLKAICQSHIGLFGELPVTDHYLFLLQLVDKGYGGLEHSNSTSLISARQDLECPDPAHPTDAYLQFLSLCSHEYFHLWNGKRICPAAYLKPDLGREAHSSLLWLVEGVTSYYDELAMVRACVVDESAYLKMLARNLSRHLRGKGRLRQSLAASSFDAWTKFYQQDENAANAISSYYTKGGLVVMMLDLSLRQRSLDRTSFDVVMRHLWQQYGKPGIGIPEDAMAGIIRDATDIDLSAELKRWVHGCEPIEEELGALLAGMGIELRLLPPAGQQLDIGHSGESPAPPWLGIGFKAHALGLEITQVHEDSPAAEALLAAGDILIALGGHQLDVSNLERLLANLAPAGQSELHLFRDARLLSRPIRLVPGPRFVAELRLLELDFTDTKARRVAWLQQNSSVS